MKFNFINKVKNIFLNSIVSRVNAKVIIEKQMSKTKQNEKKKKKKNQKPKEGSVMKNQERKCICMKSIKTS